MTNAQARWDTASFILKELLVQLECANLCIQYEQTGRDSHEQLFWSMAPLYESACELAIQQLALDALLETQL